MAMDYKVETYRKWLSENVTLSDPFSPQFIKGNYTPPADGTELPTAYRNKYKG